MECSYKDVEVYIFIFALSILKLRGSLKLLLDVMNAYMGETAQTTSISCTTNLPPQ